MKKASVMLIIVDFLVMMSALFTTICIVLCACATSYASIETYPMLVSMYLQTSLMILGCLAAGRIKIKLYSKLR